MYGFNTSGRKEDLSVKLRARNLRNAKETTRKLEQDNRKMEERLQELKQAMNQEREDRERHGGGFWQRGQTGSLKGYALEVLLDKTNYNPPKKKAVKVLKDEPLDLPSHNNGPGTFKYIAQRLAESELARDSLNKGTKCGQCEDRLASLSCVQCSECYCVSCFAAFHLKGALKRHRSVPLHAAHPRQCMSPRPAPAASSSSCSSADVCAAASSDDIFSQEALQLEGREGGASGSVDDDAEDEEEEEEYMVAGSSLLQGAYNEAESAATFQRALLAWRQGESTSDQQAKPKKVITSSVTFPVLTVEHSTSTEVVKTMPEIKFSSHSLTYAERLMLKRHRRTELGPLTSPRLLRTTSCVYQPCDLNSDTSCIISRNSDTSHIISRNTGGVLDSEVINGVVGAENEERVDFQSLFEAMTSSIQSHNTGLSGFTLATDIKHSQSSCGQFPVFTVQEVSDLDTQFTQEVMTSRKEKQQSSSARKLTTLANATTTTKPKKRIPSREAAALNPESGSITSVRSRPLDRNTSCRISAMDLSQKKEEVVLQPEAMTKPTSPVSNLPPKSLRSRQASARLQSARSQASARLQSARSQASARLHSARSRAASRCQKGPYFSLGAEGLLTKCPSSTLQQVAERSAENSSCYTSPMEAFFLVGVQLPDQTEDKRSRSQTASPGQLAKMKVSNRLYAMSPRSWHPDSSMGHNSGSSHLPSIVRYTYSGQLQDNPLQWNPHDIFSSPVPAPSSFPSTALDPAATPSPALDPAATPLPTLDPAATPSPTLNPAAIASPSLDPAATPSPADSPGRVSKALKPNYTASKFSTPHYPDVSSSLQSRTLEHISHPFPAEQSGSLERGSRPCSAEQSGTLEHGSRPFPAEQSGTLEHVSHPFSAEQSGTLEHGSRPFSAEQMERVEIAINSTASHQNKLRPNSSEPSRRRRHHVPVLDHHLQAAQKTRARGNGWTEERQEDPDISTSRTRSWVVTQNSLRPSSQWETRVEEFVMGSENVEPGSSTSRTASSKSARYALIGQSNHQLCTTPKPIVMDGEDLSKYDADLPSERLMQNTEDRKTLEELEWELASESGRLTADGKISPLSKVDLETDTKITVVTRSTASSRRLHHDQGYDINTRLRKEELPGEESEAKVYSNLSLTEEEEVKALP